MLTVSLHKIELHALVGLYEEEQIHGNNFEIDVDLFLPDSVPFPFCDYTLINDIVIRVFKKPEFLIETCLLEIHSELKIQFPVCEKIRVIIRKLRPPMPGKVAYAQVCYEK